MSCTENESGSFVVFFLPAVVGCLTILLARRWANSQVTNTSSTAVSRRRKIIKDPLIKRPLPQISTKMVISGSKKAAGVAKKGPFPEEEMNGGGKRVRPNPSTRHSPSSAPGLAMPDVKVPEGPITPKHIPFPFIPQDGELLFEVMTCIFTLVATGLQFLNLYRTAWWLPHSYTNQAMHFHLIDAHLVGVTVVILCRRVLLAATLSALRAALPPAHHAHATAAARMFILGVILGASAWCMYYLFLKYPAVKLFYLCYPAVIYVILFGFQASPFLELNSGDAPLHCCSHDPQQIAQEVETMRADFNIRVKKILFNSVVGAYYSSFIPLVFAQPYVYYDVLASSQQVGLAWGALCGRYCSQLLAAPYCDTAHRAARHLAHPAHSAHSAHHDHDNHDESHTPECVMSSSNGGERCAGRERGLGGWGAGWGAEWRVWPHTDTQHSHARFYAVFINPSMMLCLLLCMQLSLIVLQLCLLFSSIPWHNYLSIVILLFINYYTLFKMVRDYLVAWKVYKAENMIQERNYAINYGQN